MRSSQRTGQKSVPVLRRIAAILDALEKEPELSVTEVAARIGVDKSTASRQLAALVQYEYVSRDPTTGRFRLGIRLLRLGRLVAARLDIRSLALPTMARLRDVTGETVGLVIRRGLKRVYIEVLESQHQVLRTHDVGVFQDILPGAPGKVFLAHMPVEEARRVIESAGAVRLASGATVDPDAVERDLEAIRARGVSWSQDERVIGGAAAAFPVFDHTGVVAAVLCIIMPTVRATPEHQARCIAQGRAATDQLSRSLGHVPSDGGGPRAPFNHE